MTSPNSSIAEPALPLPAWIELDGVVNMRDVGGLPTDDGATIAPGRLIRSDNLQDLPPASVNHLVDGLRVTDVVDLRTFVEVAKEGDGPLLSRPEVTVHHLTLYPEQSAETGIPAGERDLPWHRDPHLGDTGKSVRIEASEDREGSARHDSYWSEHYLAYLTKRPDNVVAALRAIALAPGAVVVHCAAGKDRTGTVVGLALKLAGATDEAVVADFEASAQRVPQILARLAGRPAYSTNLDGKTVQQQSPRAQTMRMMLAVLERDHGGVEGWLATQGWTPDETARLRAKLRD
ncbi:MAG: tyrosine-protein phosphatase [Actinomycetota bacterium]|nr:tyrosine-protein phosphatase [Actinomycetota bacterium]